MIHILKSSIIVLFAIILVSGLAFISYSQFIHALVFDATDIGDTKGVIGLQEPANPSSLTGLDTSDNSDKQQQQQQQQQTHQGNHNFNNQQFENYQICFICLH